MTLTKEILITNGFEPLPHKNLLNSLNLDLGHRKVLSVSLLGTGNQMISVFEVNMSDNKVIDDMVVLSNYDYHGFMSVDRFAALFFALTGKVFQLPAEEPVSSMFPGTTHL
jgi:hypothetical protein